MNGQTILTNNPTLTWNASQGANSYRLQVASNSGFSSPVFDQSNITGTSQQVFNLSSNTYYWHVNASNLTETSDWSSTYNFAIGAVVPPLPPILLLPENTSRLSSIDPTIFSWNTSSGATSYRLQVTTNTDIVFDMDGIPGTSQPVMGLNFTTAYYWRVKAQNSFGTSDWSVSNTIVDVQKILDIPTEYSLSQNYPNPFNPSTLIQFSIPATQFVTLKIYDLFGREIEKLVNETKPPGIYSLIFNGSKLSSGNYFYRLQAGNFIQTKKLLFLK